MASRSTLRHFQVLDLRDTGRTVGNGSYATVKELDFRGLKCVGKKIHSELYDNALPDERTEMLAKFSSECDLLSRLHHPCIVQFLGLYFEPGSRLPVLVMEYLHTTLSACLDRYGVLPEEISYGILRDVALGLCYLHENAPPIIHRDLSANNVLLATNMSAKISDLGVAKIINLSPAQMGLITQTQAPGTPVYMPPEAMVARPRYTIKVDIFSYGVLMVHVLSGQWPIPEEPFQVDPNNPGEVVPVTEAERRKAFLDQIGRGHPLMDMIERCLSKADQRPVISQILPRVVELVELSTSQSLEDRVELLQTLRDSRSEIEVTREAAEAESARLGQEIEELRQQNECYLEEMGIFRHQYENHQSLSLQRQSSLFGVPDQPQLFHPQAKVHWTKCANLPRGKDKPQAVAIGEKVYIGGGDTEGNDDQFRYVIFEFHSRHNRWSPLPHCPVYFFALSQFQGRLITVGGAKQLEGITGRLHCYGNDTQQWSEFLLPLPTPRWGLSVVTTDSTIVAIGGATGFGDGNICANVEVYQTKTNLWHIVEPLPFSCWLMSVTLVSNTCYILGGFDKTNRSTMTALYASLESLMADTPFEGSRSSWKTLPDIPLKRPAACCLSGSLVAAGGRDAEGQTSRDVYVFFPLTCSWVPLALQMPEAVCTASAVQLPENRILVLGGWDGARKRSVLMGSVTVSS